MDSGHNGEVPELVNEKTLTDCYEFLHFAGVGGGSLTDMVRAIGIPTNLPESNYRQVERIKLRCIQLGFDVTSSSRSHTICYKAPILSKLKLLDIAEKQQEEREAREGITCFWHYSFQKEPWGPR